MKITLFLHLAQLKCLKMQMLKDFRRKIRAKIIGEKKLIEKIESSLLKKLEKKESAKIIDERKNGNYIFQNVDIQSGAKLEVPVTLYANIDIRNNTHIGKFTYINSGTTLFYGSTIGRYCSIGKKCEIGTVDHPIDWLSSSSFQYNIGGHFPKEAEIINQKDFKQIEGSSIGNDVWIGSLSVIKSGISIGDGAIIGANSMVVKDVPPYAIVGGVPAKIIRYRFDKHIIDRLLKVQWWKKDIEILADIKFDDIEYALEQLESL